MCLRVRMCKYGYVCACASMDACAGTGAQNAPNAYEEENNKEFQGAATTAEAYLLCHLSNTRKPCSKACVHQGYYWTIWGVRVCRAIALALTT